MRPTSRAVVVLSRQVRLEGVKCSLVYPAVVTTLSKTLTSLTVLAVAGDRTVYNAPQVLAGASWLRRVHRTARHCGPQCCACAACCVVRCSAAAAGRPPNPDAAVPETVEHVAGVVVRACVSAPAV